MLLLVIIVCSLFVLGIVAYLINNKNTEKLGNGLDTHVSFSNQIACSPQSGEEENERDSYLDGLENRIKILEQANTGTDVFRKRILDHQIALQKKFVANADKMINGTEYQWIQSLMSLQKSPEAAS